MNAFEKIIDSHIYYPVALFVACLLGFLLGIGIGFML